MPTPNQLVGDIRNHCKAIVALMRDIPERYKKLMHTSLEVSSVAIGFVPGGHILSVVNNFVSANAARKGSAA